MAVFVFLHDATLADVLSSHPHVHLELAVSTEPRDFVSVHRARRA